MKARSFADGVRVVSELADGDHARVAQRRASARDGGDTAVVLAAGVLCLLRAAVIMLVAVIIRLDHGTVIVAVVGRMIVLHLGDLRRAFGMHRSIDGGKAVASQ